ncbi:hypothetical protein V1477_009674 [Vespula maculifrons]|uniref:Uncharacterized protein n=1 Tax=Vespula maculifrons TaxID=7453 RepID=A0ABD2CB59_VESMC
MSKSINEQLNQIYNRLLILDITAKWGYSAARDDNKVGSLSDFGRASINKEITHVYFLSLVFSTFYTISLALDFDEALLEDVDERKLTKLLRKYNVKDGDTRLRETTTKWGLRPTLTVTSLVVFRTSTRGLRKFSRNAIGASINKEITHVYFLSLVFSTFYTISLALDFDEALLEDERELTKVLRKYNVKDGDTRLRETTTKWGLCPTLTVTSLVVFRTSTRGLRKFSRNAIGASINKEITHVYFLSLLFSTFYTISFVLDFDEALLEDERELTKLLCKYNVKDGDTRLRETTTKWGLCPTLAVTSLVVFRTSTSGLRNFCGCHSRDQCITEEDLDQRRCRPTSFSTNYNSSTLNFDLNRGPVFWSRRRTSKVGTKQRRGYMPKWPPQIVAQEGNYHTIELFSKVPQNSSKMVLSHILILPFCHSECSYIKSKYRHDRSCLDMSEADGVDGGAICKRGFIHLQFAEKLEAPEAERHLGSRILE